MLEKPEKWKDPAEYAEERLRVFRLYHDKHWIFTDQIRRPNRKPIVTRVLKPELQSWLDGHDFPHQLRMGSDGKSKIIFESKAHAMLFKMAWL